MKVSHSRATLYTLLGSVFNTLIVSIQAVVLIPLYLHLVGPQRYKIWLVPSGAFVRMQAFDLSIERD